VKKRCYDEDELAVEPKSPRGHQQKQRKRFVWSESLHLDFIAAGEAKAPALFI
jgi:hypothetical protein